MTTNILLIRHAAHVELGQVLSGRRRDVALSREGLEQTAIIADLLGVEPLAAVYSSPRERAYYTAREIADRLEQKVRIADALDEIDFGDWSGRRFDELADEPQWERWNAARATARAPGGESMCQATSRAVAALEELVGAHPHATVAAVSHCDIIRGVIAHHLGLSLDNILRFDIAPASVSRLALSDGSAQVVSVNERLYQ